MTEERRPLAKLLAKTGDGDFLRSVTDTVGHLAGVIVHAAGIQDRGGAGFVEQPGSKRHGVGLVRRLMQQVHGTTDLIPQGGTRRTSRFSVAMQHSPAGTGTFVGDSR